MLSFKHYLEEKKWIAAGILGGALLGSGAALIKKNVESEQIATPRVEPRLNQPSIETKSKPVVPEVETKKQTVFVPKHPIIGNLLDAFSQAEHRGTGTVDYKTFNPKHAIRTKAGGGKSSAWGVFQITGSTAKDFVTRKPHLFDDETRKYALRYSEVGKKMLKAKNNDAALGLGRPTELANPDEHHLYLGMSHAILQGMLEDMKIKWEDGINDRELIKITKRFRGVEEPKYLDIVRNHLSRR